MHKYTYTGAVCSFGKVIAYIKNAETTAPTESKARANLAYRFKKENGYGLNQKITLPGVLTKEESQSNGA